MYLNNDLKKRNFYQSIVYQILMFYFHNNLYYENKREMKLPIIGYKNNIPVLNPKFFNFQEGYSFTRQLIRNLVNLVTLPL
jgi:hypothetical protein